MKRMIHYDIGHIFTFNQHILRPMTITLSMGDDSDNSLIVFKSMKPQEKLYLFRPSDKSLDNVVVI